MLFEIKIPFKSPKRHGVFKRRQRHKTEHKRRKREWVNRMDGRRLEKRIARMICMM